MLTFPIQNYRLYNGFQMALTHENNPKAGTHPEIEPQRLLQLYFKFRSDRFSQGRKVDDMEYSVSGQWSH